MDSELYGSDAPLVFIRPIGLDAADSLRLMQAAQQLGDKVRWRLAPVGVQADVYLAHRANVVVGAPPTRPQDDSLQAASTLNSTYEHSHIYLSDGGYYKNQPVCLLGNAPDTDRGSLDSTYLPALQFPAALQELRLGLYSVQEQLIGVRVMYALGRHAWLERKRWKTHNLHVIDAATLIAVIEPLQWKVHLSGNAHIDQIETAATLPVPQTNAFAADKFDVLPLEQLLWEFAKRCPQDLLEKIMPGAFLREPLTHRRITQLSERELGDHCVAILRALDTRSRTADELQTSLRMSRPALLRALACLALTRSIRPEKHQAGLLERVRAWLPKGLRKRVVG